MDLISNQHPPERTMPQHVHAAEARTLASMKAHKIIFRRHRSAIASHNKFVPIVPRKAVSLEVLRRLDGFMNIIACVLMSQCFVSVSKYLHRVVKLTLYFLTNVVTERGVYTWKREYHSTIAEMSSSTKKSVLAEAKENW